MKPTLTSVLDAAASTAVIAAASVFVWSLVTKPEPVRREPAYKLGDEFKELQTLRLSGPVLALFVRSTCPFCTDSAAFYRTLAAFPDRPPLVVLGPESEPTLQDYIFRLDLKVDAIRAVKPGDTKFTGTPSIVAIDKSGVVRGFWQGQLASAQEAKVLETIASIAK